MKVGGGTPYIASSALVSANRTWRIFFGPGGFACATRGGVAIRNWALLLPSFSLLFLRLLLLTHFEESPMCKKKVGDNNGQAMRGARKHAWRTQAAWANSE